MSLISAAASGNHLETLEQLRDELASAFAEAPAISKAPLSKQLLDVLAQIQALKPPEKKKDTPLDELAKRKADREANAKGPTVAARVGQRI
ncbi:hypothetical protein CH253_08170 [Rhodococcus sp. 06-156-3C]|uniref:hypothetical protein n=1 Tax=Rhodococcus sp. 06-156-3C TaxID=2022486 RepID=UPI000B9B68FA|nr:hypothetical protein [Rhodococcus sp. 06-156-3C]OZD23828.1 hypothetical protein CH253_08170 [Rhodococcus sp. 06-156-3C]